VPDALHQLRDPIAYAIPVFALFIAIDLLAVRLLGEEPPDGARARAARTNLSMGLGGVALGVLFRTLSLAVYAALYTYLAPWHLPADRWQTWLLMFVLVDLLWYVYHRVSHRVRLVWAAHQVHHSSEFFDFSTAVRQKWNQWFESVVWLPLPLLGLPPWLIYTAFSVNLIYQFFTHTERVGRLPAPVEYLFNTPSHHRVHHGSDALYLDRNYGGILIVWDRLFGTYQEEVHRPTYGLTKPVTTTNLLRLQFGEYADIARDVRAAAGWRSRLGYVFGPPGWQPAVRAAGAATGEDSGAGAGSGSGAGAGAGSGSGRADRTAA
jgi:sterol desaturase/sphingolipid hydroxylase (fatty acid hydroxylase superfamily)